MEKAQWKGVFTAITTPFDKSLAVDHKFLAEHANWLISSGCTGIVALGSLGEAATLQFDEKVAIVATLRKALPKNIPVVAGIAGLSTAECVSLAQKTRDAGADGLMVLPPYVYKGDWRETEAHFSAVITATKLSCMLYNNPIAYGTDVSAEQVEQLGRHANLHAVKESSGDVRRVTAIRERLDDRMQLFAGMDDMILESIPMGAQGWIAGLVNAFPAESVRVFEAGLAGKWAEARRVYEWFLPLLRLDTVPKFVQLIKLVQQEIGRGSEIVRPPRLVLTGAEREQTIALIRERIASRPSLK
jgi:dihydrodipicolinate synthase/N-acetylneuraminate lyase